MSFVLPIIWCFTVIFTPIGKWALMDVSKVTNNVRLSNCYRMREYFDDVTEGLPDEQCKVIRYEFGRPFRSQVVYRLADTNNVEKPFVIPTFKSAIAEAPEPKYIWGTIINNVIIFILPSIVLYYFSNFLLNTFRPYNK